MWKSSKEWFFTINLSMLLVLNLFLILMAVLAVTTLCGLAAAAGWAQVKELLHPAAVTVLLYSVSVLLAVSVVVMIRLVILKPVARMVGAMQRLAGGDFSVRMTCDGWMRPLELREFTAAFNKAAEELAERRSCAKISSTTFRMNSRPPSPRSAVLPPCCWRTRRCRPKSGGSISPSSRPRAAAWPGSPTACWRCPVSKRRAF